MRRYRSGDHGGDVPYDAAVSRFAIIEKMSLPKDYTGRSFTFTLLVIAMLVGISFIPSFRVGGTVFKRANILSDVVTFEDDIPVVEQETEMSGWEPDGGTSEGIVTAGGVDTLADSGAGRSNPALAIRDDLLSVPRVSDTSVVQIVDYSPDCQMMAAFYHALAYEADTSTVRIAVLGDSFIEADIITADMREQLQITYGGRGVGFVPFSTPLSKYRGTVDHDHEGWTDYNLIKRKSVPEEYRDRFCISGMLSVPSEGAYSEYCGVDFRQRIAECGTASLLFVNRDNTLLDVSVNGAPTVRYAPQAGESLQRIAVECGGDISSLEVDVTQADGFIGYGVVLEDSVGVSVHNFSVRSNSGLALLGTSYDINSRLNDYMAYDMVILQYGLNAMSADVTNYTYYGRQLERIINYIKQCFPGSAIVVMSVGDRSTMENGHAVTMPAVKAMLRSQEAAARACGVGFWNTYEAMGGDNSMPKFVERKWAAKDYTHIGYPGGKYIAEQFVRFIDAAVASVEEIDARREAAREAAREAELRRTTPPCELPGGEVLKDSVWNGAEIEVGGETFRIGIRRDTCSGESSVSGGEDMYGRQPLRDEDMDDGQRYSSSETANAASAGADSADAVWSGADTASSAVDKGERSTDFESVMMSEGVMSDAGKTAGRHQTDGFPGDALSGDVITAPSGSGVGLNVDTVETRTDSDVPSETDAVRNRDHSDVYSGSGAAGVGGNGAPDESAGAVTADRAVSSATVRVAEDNTVDEGRRI